VRPCDAPAGSPDLAPSRRLAAFSLARVPFARIARCGLETRRLDHRI
jgi:hypothetical protein